MSSSYIPDRGDVVWINFDPSAGREQAGRRPAVVMSPKNYNRPSRLALFCPVTNRSKGYPFEVPLPEDSPITGVILVDQLRNLDWHSRQVTFIAKLPEPVLREVTERLRPLLALDDE